MITSSALQILPASSDNTTYYVGLQPATSGRTNNQYVSPALTFVPSLGILTLGGNVSVTGSLAAQSLSLSNVTTATSTSSGALTVAGGLGVGGAVYIGNRISAASGLINQSYDQGLGNFQVNGSASFNGTVTETTLNLQGGNNLFQYSQDYSQPSWLKPNGSVSGFTNAIVAPDGTTTGNLLTENGTVSTLYRIQQSFTIVSGPSYTLSCYLKAGTRTWAYIQLQGTGSNYAIQYVNLLTGTLGTLALVGSMTSPTASITSVDNGWYKVVLTAGIPAGTALNAFIGTAITDNNQTVTGVIGSGLYLWGAQLELGTTVSPYTPTTTAAITTANNINVPSGRILVASGSLAAPAFAFAAAPSNGWYLADAPSNDSRFASNGSDQFRITPGAIILNSVVPFQWGSSGASTADTSLYRDGAGILAQRLGATAQTLRVYNTFTDASNYERLTFGWSSNTATIGVESSGTGIQRNIAFSTSTTSFIGVGTTTPTTKLDVIGGVRVTGITTITNATSASSVNSGALQVAGGVGIVGSLYVGGASTFSGPVTFNSTVTTIATTNSVYTNSIVELHTPSGDPTALWATDDGQDIGIRFHYYTASTGTRAGLVLSNSSKKLEWYNTGYNNSGTFTGTYGTFKTGAVQLVGNAVNVGNTSSGDLQVSGGVGIGGGVFIGGAVTATNATLSATTNATSTTTGALIVLGGVGIGGNAYVGNILGLGTSTGQTLLISDSANALAQRNGATAQTFRLYNSFTDASNYERLGVSFVSNTATINAEYLGTGVQRHIALQTISGNVGIGIANPNQKLEISTNTNFQLRVGNGSSSSAYTYDMGRNTADGLLYFYGNQTANTGYVFSGVDGERMRISSTGTVSIGTTTGSSKLTVSTTIQSGNLVTDGSLTASLSTTTQTAVDTTPVATSRAIKYIVQATYSSNYQVSELLIVQNGTVANVVEYGIVHTSTSPLVTYDADISGGTVRLLASAVTATTTLKIIKLSVV